MGAHVKACTGAYDWEPIDIDKLLDEWASDEVKV
jgi:hypothetical protein